MLLLCQRHQLLLRVDEDFVSQPGQRKEHSLSATLTYPSGKVVAITYTQGQATTVTVDGVNVATAITYTPFGAVLGYRNTQPSSAAPTGNENRVRTMKPDPKGRFMEEDNDSKIRRNLVVASAIVVLIAWLGLPITDGVIERLVGTTAKQVHGYRVWVAISLVLVYLTLRYRLTELFAVSLLEMQSEPRQLRERAVRRSLQGHANRFQKSGKDPVLVDNGFTGAIDPVSRSVAAHRNVSWDNARCGRSVLNSRTKVSKRACARAATSRSSSSGEKTRDSAA